MKEIRNKDLKDVDIEYKEMALEAMNNLLESIMIHENHFSSTLEKIIITSENILSGANSYENILNYEKDCLTNWDYFSFIIEKFIERYLIEKELHMKIIIVERIQTFVNSKKCVKFNNNEEMQNWLGSLICLLIVFLDECESTDKESIFLGISRLFTGLGVFDLDHSTDYLFVLDNISRIFKDKF